MNPICAASSVLRISALSSHKTPPSCWAGTWPMGGTICPSPHPPLINTCSRRWRQWINAEGRRTAHVHWPFPEGRRPIGHKGLKSQNLWPSRIWPRADGPPNRPSARFHVKAFVPHSFIHLPQNSLNFQRPTVHKSTPVSPRAVHVKKMPSQTLSTLVVLLLAMCSVLLQFAAPALAADASDVREMGCEKLAGDEDRYLLCQLYESSTLLAQLGALVNNGIERLVATQALKAGNSGADAGRMEKRKHEYLRFGKRKHEFVRFG